MTQQRVQVMNEEQKVIGTLFIEEGYDIWDTALTPIVAFDKEDSSVEPEVTGFLMHARTKMDTRKHAEDHPFLKTGDEL